MEGIAVDCYQLVYALRIGDCTSKSSLCDAVNGGSVLTIYPLLKVITDATWTCLSSVICTLRTPRYFSKLGKHNLIEGKQELLVPCTARVATSRGRVLLSSNSTLKTTSSH